MKAALALLGALALGAHAPRAEVSAFELALTSAERSLDIGELDKARALVQRALERDAKAPRAWAVRARWAEAAGERDELVYALHKQLRLLEAQQAPKAELQACRERLLAADPLGKDLLGLRQRFVEKLRAVAQAYEKDRRPHSAIRVHKEILALDPEQAPSQEAIERIAAAPDPSLAADAKPVDLLAGVSEEWIRGFDEEHREWEARAKLERQNYVTHTNAGYEVLVRSAEAMEQMNAFYRQFFDYKTDGESVGRIDLVIFRTREEYLELGSGPPVEWSGGQFTGGSVETYVEGGFETMIGTLFHEAAHQFVSLSTNASGWLNEGLASFFEGCRILPNGTVLMNMPANHRLFPLVERMQQGWMTDENDGIDPAKPADSNPAKAPTFRIVLEDKYAWGPPWYAPTWGVVYFLYNYQDPVDGRYVYRKAFREFVDKSGGRVGAGAVENFEEVVLANPQSPIAGIERPQGLAPLALPATIGALDATWKDFMVRLRDEQSGVLVPERPYLRWALAAIQNQDLDVAQEHFEKGLVATPRDVQLLIEFAEFLAGQRNTDRATKLALAAVRELESREEVDLAAVREIERKLERWDPKRASLERVHRELWDEARRLVLGYRQAQLPLMVMDIAWRMEVELGVPGLFEYYAEAQRQSGKSLAIWSLAYNEHDLEGWDPGQDDVYQAEGPFLTGHYGEYKADDFSYRMLGLDEVTAGDFSMQVEVQAERGEVGFCGIVFGRKDQSNFHTLIFFPPKPDERTEAGVASSGFVDLASFYGGTPKVWRHNPVAVALEAGRSTSGTWHELRIDIAGKVVDAWVDGQYLATQEFPSADVLRGSFGLILGPGRARFREVRFLARHPRDPAAALERERRLETVQTAGGGSVGGSWLGQPAPFPQVSRWVQEPRESWTEKGPVPQLLVLWSIQQNEIVPIDSWLCDLELRHEEVGLQIVAVTSPNDDQAIEAYLAEHPFPGPVAVDRREGLGIGDTNELYSTLKFNLPRLVLLDLDGKVAWEGDPGFAAAEPWKRGDASYLDTPLAELIERRKVRELRPWVAAWTSRGLPALFEGDLSTALPLLQQARGFERGLLVEIGEAQRRLEALEGALSDLERSAAALASEGRQPALEVLLEWADLAGIEVERKARAVALRAAKSGEAEAWQRTLAQVQSRRERIARDPGVVAELVASLGALSGPFPAELAQRLAGAGGAGAEIEAILASAEGMPRRWLARNYFNW